MDCCSWALCEALLLIDHVWSQERSKETRGRWRPGTAWVKSLGFSFDGFWVPDPEMAHHSWSFRRTYYFIYFTICSYHFHHWNILKLHPFRVRNFIHTPSRGVQNVIQFLNPSSVCWYSALGWETLRSTEIVWRSSRRALWWWQFGREWHCYVTALNPVKMGIDWLTPKTRAMLSREQDEINEWI